MKHNMSFSILCKFVIINLNPLRPESKDDIMWANVDKYIYEEMKIPVWGANY